MVQNPIAYAIRGCHGSKERIHIMYSITPLQYSEPAMAFGYFMLICVACTAIIAFLVFLSTKRDTFPIGFVISAVFIIFAIIAFGTPPTPAPEIGYDVTALGRGSVLSINRQYITARGVSKAVGRPVGNAGMLTCDDKRNMNSSLRPVSYLADDGTIRQGVLKIERSSPEWKITLTDSKGKALARPAHEIGAEPGLSVTSNDDEDSLALIADNGAKGCKTSLGESRYSISRASTVLMKSDDGSMVSISSNHGNGVIVGMPDGETRHAHMIILNGKAYVMATGSNDGKPITIG